jgi:hypothetical protein
MDNYEKWVRSDDYAFWVRPYNLWKASWGLDYTSFVPWWSRQTSFRKIFIAKVEREHPLGGVSRKSKGKALG